MTSVKHGSTLNVTILTIWTINIYKVVISQWCCLSCNNTLLPFGNLNNENFLDFIGNNNNTITSSETKNLNSSVLLKPTPDLALLFNQFNNALPENRSDPENIIQSKYYDRDELQKLKFLIRRTLYLYFTSFLVH